jgi:hypothetical protein
MATHGARSLSGTRRRRRGLGWVLVLLIVVLALLFLVATSAYQLAASRFGTETSRLRQDMTALLEQNRLLSERVAAAEQRGAMAVARAAQVDRDRRAGLPQGDAARLLRAIERKLGEGVPPQRLSFVLDNATPQPRCEDKIETKRIQPRTPSSTNAAVTATFADSKVTASAQATLARSGTAGQAEPGFDATQPVELRFTTIGGGIETARGVLPVGHSFVFGQKELRFIAKAVDKAPGTIELSLQSCAYP